MATTWPKKGWQGKQPWEDGVGSPSVEPLVGVPLLTSGSADPVVHTAFAQLGELGYDNPVARGENPYGVVGPEELQAARQFRNDFNVHEDPTMFGGDHQAGREAAENHIGPWTLTAIARAHDQLGDDE